MNTGAKVVAAAVAAAIGLGGGTYVTMSSKTPDASTATGSKPEHRPAKFIIRENLYRQMRQMDGGAR